VNLSWIQAQLADEDPHRDLSLRKLNWRAGEENGLVNSEQPG
jgi:hypothetical protein